MSFNKKEYDIKYKKEKKSQFKVDLNKNENLKYNCVLKVKNITKVDFVRENMKKLEVEFNMKEKKELIKNMISEIINNAVKSYTAKFDENAGMSNVEGTIKGFDGEVIKYISHSDFKDLYGNFKYDLDKANEDTLDIIIKYLEEEAKYINYEDLDRDTNCIEDFM